MRILNTGQLDLNLLVVLKQLLEEKHVSNTALSLGMSQPAVSRALHKLRVVFNDELLIRSGEGYQITERGKVLQSELDQVLQGLETLMQGDSFDPASSTKTIKLFALVPQATALVPKLFSELRERAPNMHMAVDTVPQHHFSGLESGDVHFVMSTAQPDYRQQNLYRLPIQKRDFRLLMSETHPLASKETLEVDDLLTASMGRISLYGDTRFNLQTRLREKGYLGRDESLNVPISLTNFNLAASIAESSDVIFHLPTPYAKQVAKTGKLILKEVPEDIRSDKEQVYVYWHKRFQNDGMCTWFRELIKEVYSVS
ncbi:LysR family transcriptional regulator [Vibrio breoganii]|uniref:LysR substrate-binding domain-containing protein n=1 Tax=Vibrio breoganii TaxID=553239 RepID=UPI000C83BDA0|nr:LysR substrate-binding domain-containing protein [Vibrio breoganii]PMF97029.1 LysR family transcriptional regulator [Vibrio breoganii]PMG83856.1 LysR family transcriptional regulator [Vibrio breoganii]PMI23009.1 LysR family transcriptional regulator [Vibrio breoganii]PMK28081.1 LysR family transcriptional regulator [Vibrio breoganii]PMK60626.1 LysR family transcriptional regulator [Vibrio breoganii]